MEQCARSLLHSRCHASINRCASCNVRNQCSFRHVLGSKKWTPSTYNQRSGGVRWNAGSTTEVYEGVSGASGAARARTGRDDSGGGETTRHLRQDARELGVSSPTRPTCEAGGEPTARDGFGDRGVPAQTRFRRSPHGARHPKKATAYFAKAQLPGTRS